MFKVVVVTQHKNHSLDRHIAQNSPQPLCRSIW
jgi:hypothetical protein